MSEGNKKWLALLSIALISMSPFFLFPGEESEFSQSHNYPQLEIEIFLEGEIFEFRPDSVEFHQNWSISPSLPDGLRMFTDSFLISDMAIDSHGNRTCSVTPIGGIVCWSDFSQYNDFTEILFEDVNEGGFVTTAISVGGKHSCALVDDSVSTEIRCWGSDSKGQMADGYEREDNHSPSKIAQIEGSWTDISSGDVHSCGILEDSEIYCWGGGEFGQIGDGIRSDRFIPTQVVIEGDKKFVSVKSGDFHNCALTSEGEVWCWGWNGYGQIGNGDFEDAFFPSRVDLGEGVIAKRIFTGPAHSCAIIETDYGYCWGSNTENQISHGEDEGFEEPLRIFPDYKINEVGILTGNSISCIEKADDELDCIGSMGSGWMGHIEQIGEIRHFSPGRGGFCILNSSGNIRCTDNSGSKDLMTEEGGVFQLIVPSILDAGSIYGTALNNGNSRHNITSTIGGNEVKSTITILVDFERDIDSDGWLNYEEEVCNSEIGNKSSTPLDTDLDGECDGMDDDDDGDGVLDFKDKFPLDRNEWSDDDGDGVGKNADSFEFSQPVYGILVTMSILLVLFVLEIRISSSRRKIE